MKRRTTTTEEMNRVSHKFNRIDGWDGRILSVSIVREVDDSPDLSHLGEYSDKRGADDDKTVDRFEHGAGRRELRYFIAAMSGEETGNPASVLQDYERMESYNRGEWWSYGIRAVARVVLTGGVIQHFTSGGIWGVESDSDAAYFREVESEELHELREQLKAAGFVDSEIEKACEAASYPD